MNETIKTLLERRSIRSFKSEQVKNDDLDLILKAGTYAPTARGTQAPVMVVVQDAETITEMEKLMRKLWEILKLGLFTALRQLL